MHTQYMRTILSSIGIAGFLAYSAFAEAAPVRRLSRPTTKPAPRDPRALLDWEAGEEAGKAMDHCIAEHVTGDYLICNGEWRGIRYKVSPNYDTEISIPSASSTSAVTWKISCDRDKMNDNLSCYAFHYMSNYGMSGVSIIQSYNNRVVAWGREVYPGTTPQVRFGYGQPINVSRDSMFVPTVADRLVEGMRLNDRVIFRYISWPERIPVDVEIDTSRYRELEALMNAVFVRYRRYVEGQ